MFFDMHVFIAPPPGFGVLDWIMALVISAGQDTSRMMVLAWSH